MRRAPVSGAAVNPSNQKFKGFIADGMAFDVPSWKDAPLGKGLAAPPPPDTSLVPDIFAHRFEEMDKEFDPVLHEVQSLTQAKRKAAMSLLYRDGSAENEAISNEAEQMVSRRRIDLLSRFILAPNESLCTRSQTSPYDAGVSVQYRRLQYMMNHTETVRKLQASQSPVSWTAEAGLKWVDIGGICASSEEVPSELLTRIIKKSMANAFKDESTAELRRLVNQIPLETPLVFSLYKHEEPVVAAIWEPAEPTQSIERTFTAEMNAEGFEPITFTVLMGTLDINYSEEWHNENINKYIQKTVMKAGERAIENMEGCDEDDRKKWMWNILKPCIRISQGWDVHTLTLSPFINPDCCTVLHLHLNKDIAGLCDINEQEIQDVANWGDQDFLYDKGSLMRVYHCVSPSHTKRFNEQELGYIHSGAFKESNTAAGINPIEEKFCIWHDGEEEDDHYSHSKSARIAFTEWDVLATSIDTYPITLEDGTQGNEVKTIITLVNYPPPGARYARDPPGTTKKLQPEAEPFVPGNGKIRRSREDMFKLNPNGGFTWKESAKEENHRKNNTWKEIPSMGHMYYIPGLHADSFSKKEWHVWLIDTSPMNEDTRGFMTEAIRIRDEIYAKYHECWKDSYTQQPWMNNIEHNTEKPDGEGKTIREYYVHEWRMFLRKWISEKKLAAFRNASMEDDSDSGLSYVYCENPVIWNEILEEYGSGTYNIPTSDIEHYKTYSVRRYEYEVTREKIKPVIQVKREKRAQFNKRAGPPQMVEKRYPRHPYRFEFPPEKSDFFHPAPTRDYIEKMFPFYIPGIRSDEFMEAECMTDPENVMFFVDNSSDFRHTPELTLFSLKLKTDLRDRFATGWIALEEENDPEREYYYNIDHCDQHLATGESMLHEYISRWVKFISEWIEKHKDGERDLSCYFYSRHAGIWEAIFPWGQHDRMEEYKMMSEDRYNKDVKAIKESEMTTEKPFLRPQQVKSGHSPHIPTEVRDNTTPHSQFDAGGLFFIPGLYTRLGKITMDTPQYNIYVIPTGRKNADMSRPTIFTESQIIMNLIYSHFKEDSQWVKDTPATNTREKEVLYNIQQNKVDKVDNIGIHELYLDRWKDYIASWIIMQRGWHGRFEGHGHADFFLYCAEPIVWNQIFPEDDEQEVKNAWIAHSNMLFKDANVKIPGVASAARIELPPSLIRQEVPSHTELASTMSEMKERIQTLEARLTQARQDENRDHLLKQVLAKLSLRNGL